MIHGIHLRAWVQFAQAGASMQGRSYRRSYRWNTWCSVLGVAKQVLAEQRVAVPPEELAEQRVAVPPEELAEQRVVEMRGMRLSTEQEQHPSSLALFR
jgi:hypothetical protein